ncbi:MAG: helix-turn-helix domain containing protein [Porticoccaceae bacterium]|nr:helix-turn-helix domain containing protein [Porticoccaceae bacterium]
MKLTKSENDFKEVMQRAKLVTNATTWTELAEILEMSTGDLANRKKRGTLPLDRLIDMANSRNVSIDWLLSGEGSMYRGGDGSMRREEPAESLSPKEEAVLALFRALDDDAQREIQQVAAEKKRLRDVEQRLEELSSELALSKNRA